MSTFSTATTPVDAQDDSPSSSSVLQPTEKPVRRREKTQFSCTLCRSKKLKCDRNQPCRSCIGRGTAHTCTYIQNTSRSRSTVARSSHGTPSSNIQNKISQLEDMVVSLMASVTASKEGKKPATDTKEIVQPEVMEVESDSPESLADNLGRITLEHTGTKYVDNAHWTAILDGISELKGQFEDDPVPVHEAPPELQDDSHETPTLLFGRNNHATKQEILSGIPSRNIMDRLVSKYFNSLDMAPVVLHRFTFLKEYESFWENPSEAPIMWIGLLYTILCLAVNFQRITQENNPSASNILYPLSEEPQVTIQRYKEKIVQCLILGKYTKAPPYTIQTLLLYLAVEHFGKQDAQIGTYILLGIVVRIAMRMGYHRDGAHMPNLSPYQVEMRRRTWAMVKGVDVAVSHQTGLPRMLREEIYDTAEPRNLMDADFHEHSLEIPASRPVIEITPMLAITVKNTLLDVYATIVDLTAYTKQTPYSEVARLDAKLCEVKANLPPPYQFKSMSQSVAEPSELVMCRISFDVTFHAGRCNLHRSYMTLGRTSPAFKISRHECLASAVQLLRHQYTLNEEMQPGGRLSEDRWKITSMINHEFLVGTTILCLDVNRTLEEGEVTGPCRDVFDEREGRESIIDAMMKGWEVWEVLSGKSRDAQRGAEALGLIFRKMGKKPGGPFEGMVSKFENSRSENSGLKRTQAFETGTQIFEPSPMSNASSYGTSFGVGSTAGFGAGDGDVPFDFNDFDAFHIPTDQLTWDDWDLLQNASEPDINHGTPFLY